MKYYGILILLFMFSGNSVAFKVDSLSKVIDSDSQFFTLTGESEREYIYTYLTRVTADAKGKISETPVAPEKVSQWPVFIDPGEIILDKGDEVKVRISRNEISLQDDIVMGLSFIPESSSLKSSDTSGLQVAVGYKAWLFIPGKSPMTGDVRAYRTPGHIKIVNSSNKILRVMVDDCQQSTQQSCQGAVMTLPGTEKMVSASGNKVILNIYMIDSNQKQIKEITL